LFFVFQINVKKKKSLQKTHKKKNKNKKQKNLPHSTNAEKGTLERMQGGLLLGLLLVLSDGLMNKWMSACTAEVIRNTVASGEFQNCMLF